MFSKKPAAPARPVRTADPVASTRSSGSVNAGSFSVLGADLVVKGDLSASADLHIDGRIEGDISCTALVQGEASEVRGGISAKSARLAGTVHGAIHVGELVILRTAKIHGDVTYDALTIEQGAEVDGRFSHNLAGSARARHDEGGSLLSLAN